VIAFLIFVSGQLESDKLLIKFFPVLSELNYISHPAIRWGHLMSCNQ
jgi:hypothetical protein